AKLLQRFGLFEPIWPAGHHPRQHRNKYRLMSDITQKLDNLINGRHDLNSQTLAIIERQGIQHPTVRELVIELLRNGSSYLLPLIEQCRHRFFVPGEYAAL